MNIDVLTLRASFFRYGVGFEVRNTNPSECLTYSV